ncbi:MAG: hypothetical protein HWE27_07045 [Gammaproteobacteria bacterium]|nr:hypothetical protein [Gammaproteobacteria bacterium]
MESLIKKAKANWRLKQHTHRMSQWIFGPVFLVTAGSLVFGIQFSSLSEHYVDKGFWQATKVTFSIVLQAIGM